MRLGRPERLAQRKSACQGGFTYLALLAVVAVLGLGLARLGTLWAESDLRERERELLRIGSIYAQAIADYRASSPGSFKRFPRSMNELLLDTRFVGTRRHLRRLYLDPLRPDRPWGLVRDASGGITGVFSQDERQPLTRVSVDLGAVVLPPASRYAEWVFGPPAPLGNGAATLS